MCKWQMIILLLVMANKNPKKLRRESVILLTTLLATCMQINSHKMKLQQKNMRVYHVKHISKHRLHNRHYKGKRIRNILIIGEICFHNQNESCFGQFMLLSDTVCIPCYCTGSGCDKFTLPRAAHMVLCSETVARTVL